MTQRTVLDMHNLVRRYVAQEILDEAWLEWFLELAVLAQRLEQLSTTRVDEKDIVQRASLRLGDEQQLLAELGVKTRRLLWETQTLTTELAPEVHLSFVCKSTAKQSSPSVSKFHNWASERELHKSYQ